MRSRNAIRKVRLTVLHSLCYTAFVFKVAACLSGASKCYANFFALSCSRFPVRAFLFALTSALAYLLACASACRAEVLSWNPDVQGQFITALCPGTNHAVWIGTEDDGVWRCDPSAPKDKQYTHYTQQDGLGDNNAYALVCDKAGRVWAGTLNHGVSVFNGKTWRTYGPQDGPLGSRVFALAVNPKDGGVWGATEAGLFHYAHSRWTYFTRADGLPSWRTVPGPSALPNAPSGTGLPSALINCLLVASNGTVYAGTNCGLASSQDKGRTWHYRRGLDWKAKEEGLSPPVTPAAVTVSGNLLSEDYVTCLAEGADGSLFVGHRQTGVEAFSPKTGLRVQSGLNGAKTDSFLSALLVSGQGAWAGLYGGGVLPPGAAPARTSLASSFVSSVPAVPLPVPAKPPTLAELNALLARVKSLHGDMPAGSAVCLGEDWQTQGDWLGHYGRQYTVLFAADAPLDHDIISDPAYRVQVSMGPNHPPGDSIRRFCGWVQTDDPKSLYDPIPGVRRQSEADDHGEALVDPGNRFNLQGPDVWVALAVPEGLHRVSVYDFNKDGHNGDNRFRDYLVDVLPYQADQKAVQTEAPLARARILNFWGGVYQSFLMRGPSKYVMRVARNGSLNTILPGVFIDRIGGLKTRRDCNAWMGGVRYAPPDPDAPIPPDPHLLDKLLAGGGKLASPTGGPTPQNQKLIIAARALWDALDAAQACPAALPLLLPGRRLAYRAAVAAGASDALQAAWRWTLHLWTASDRQEFNDITHQAHESLLTLNPDMRNHSY